VGRASAHRARAARRGLRHPVVQLGHHQHSTYWRPAGAVGRGVGHADARVVGPLVLLAGARRAALPLRRCSTPLAFPDQAPSRFAWRCAAARSATSRRSSPSRPQVRRPGGRASRVLELVYAEHHERMTRSHTGACAYGHDRGRDGAREDVARSSAGRRCSTTSAAGRARRDPEQARPPHRRGVGDPADHRWWAARLIKPLPVAGPVASAASGTTSWDGAPARLAGRRSRSRGASRSPTLRRHHLGARKKPMTDARQN
jgi:hypothetical protein